MSWKNTVDRYGLISIGFHWVMFLLLVAVYACIELRVLYPKGSDPRDALKSWHFMLGLSVFVGFDCWYGGCRQAPIACLQRDRGNFLLRN